MHIRALLLAGGLALLPLSPSHAALPTPPISKPSNDKAIVVTGIKDPSGKPIPMSDWHVAETEHVLVYSKGDTKDLARIAANLEKEHFLLSMLFNRVDDQDNTAKISVTMIGDPIDFDHLKLKNVRWQQGPYPRDFTNRFYYDPREDGAVTAAPHEDQKVVFQRGVPLSMLDLKQISGQAVQSPGQSPLQATPDAVNTLGLSNTGVGDAGEVSATITAESRLYAGYAQHYLLTYFPAAYPRWYLEGFGEIFATMDADKEGQIQYGQVPQGYRDSMERYGHYPVAQILDGTYLSDKHSSPAFTPYQAWALVHLLFFDEQWKAPLHNYLAAVATGANPDRAAKALGDLKALQKQLTEYHGKNVPYEQLTFAAGRFSPPAVRQLRQGEARLVQGRLQLGSRVETAGLEGRAQDKALAAQDDWLSSIRSDAARFSYEPEAQLLLAEGECRSGHNAECLAAANTSLELAPGNSAGLTWKGTALMQQAIAGPAADRDAALKEARATIIEANHADNDAVLPLIAYYRSYAEAGQTAPDVMLDGLQKTIETVPSAPVQRVMLGSELVHRGDAADARRTLLPVAKGPFDSPERPKADALLQRLPRK